MTVRLDRYRPLLRPLSISGLLIVAGVAILTISLRLHTDARQTSAAADTRLAELQARYQQSQETRRLTQDVLAAWAQHLNDGLSAKPGRVFWLEGIEAMGKLRGIEIADYELGPEIPLRAGHDDLPSPLIALQPIHIRAIVAHEDKFIELVSAIKKLGKATAKECRLSLTTKPEAASTSFPLDVECQFDMLVLSQAPK